jgi:hypothetical protein
MLTAEQKEILFAPKRGRRTSASREMYDDARDAFARLIIDRHNRLGFRISGRGFCYILENDGIITKGQFEQASSLINACRKDGRLPINVTADDDTRAADGLFEADLDDVRGYAEYALAIAHTMAKQYRPHPIFDGIDYYVEMAVEKIDLKGLFGPICSEYHVPIFNAKGWADINSRAAMMKRFRDWEERGKQCVLLYCGDHDPGGLIIAETLRKNLADLSRAVGWSPDKLIIERFGLDAAFVDFHGFSWIDNLETSSGSRLDDPRHADHRKAYVQNYIEKYGVRKVEANVLVTKPDVGRDLCESAINRYIQFSDVRAYDASLAGPRLAVVRELKERAPEYFRDL